MKTCGLRWWSGWEKDMVDGCQVGRLVNEWMKEMEKFPLAHILKGDGKEEMVEDMQVQILGYRDPKWMKETMDLGWWIWVYKDPKWKHGRFMHEGSLWISRIGWHLESFFEIPCYIKQIWDPHSF